MPCILRPSALALAVSLGLGACASHGPHYYQNDGPPAQVPVGLASVPDAVPRVEPINPYANRPYTALGRNYTPDTSDGPFEQRGIASWYGRQYHGNRTASGEPYDMFAMSAAHPTLPIPSYARVTNAQDGRSVVVRINDRGPFVQDRIIDLSYAAALRLGIAGPGSGAVLVHKLTSGEIAQAGAAAPAAVAAAPVEAAPPPAATAAVPVPVPVAVAGTAALAPLAAATEAARAAAPAAPAEAAAPPPALAAPAPVPAAAPTAAPAAAPDPVAGNRAAESARVEVALGATETAPAAAPSTSGWAVQFGAFAVPAHARTLRDDLARRLTAFDAGTLPAAAGSPRVELRGRLQRVLMGQLPDRKAALALAAQLGQLLGVQTSVLGP
jgi:rare lipoprotein A